MPVKHTILLFLVFLAAHVHGQSRPVKKERIPTDSLTLNSRPVILKKTGIPKSLVAEIDSVLRDMLGTYVSQPSNADTWKQIRAQAENILMQYFRSGKLVGLNASQAFYVRIGADTMTAADISNHLFILLAGVAISKPAEFTELRIEKKGSQ